MEKTIVIGEVKNKEICEPLSKIIFKESGVGKEFKSEFVLKDFIGYIKPNSTRMTLIIRESNNKKNLPEVTFKTQKGNEFNMTFLEMCDIFDIGRHVKNFDKNYFSETKVIK